MIIAPLEFNILSNQWTTKHLKIVFDLHSTQAAVYNTTCKLWRSPWITFAGASILACGGVNLTFANTFVGIFRNQNLFREANKPIYFRFTRIQNQLILKSIFLDTNNKLI